MRNGSRFWIVIHSSSKAGCCLGEVTGVTMYVFHAQGPAGPRRTSWRGESICCGSGQEINSQQAEDKEAPSREGAEVHPHSRTGSKARKWPIADSPRFIFVGTDSYSTCVYYYSSSSSSLLVLASMHTTTVCILRARTRSMPYESKYYTSRIMHNMH